MFSVKVGKLLEMTETESKSYSDFAGKLIQKTGGAKIIALIGAGPEAIKVAKALTGENTRVLFVDADFTTPVFLGKYRLGKKLTGWTDVCQENDAQTNGTQTPGAQMDVGPGTDSQASAAGTKADIDFSEDICVTSDPKLDLLFTGNAQLTWNEQMRKKLRGGLAEAAKQYAYVVVSSDEQGRAARCADVAVIAMKQTEYSDYNAKTRIQRLDREGVRTAGILLFE